MSTTLVYKSYSKSTGASRELILKENKTFDFNYQAGLIAQTSSGKWFNEDSEIVLKSDLVFKNGFLEVRQMDTRESDDAIRIKIIDKADNVPIPLAMISINTNENAVTDEKGVATFTKVGFSSLEVHYLGEIYEWKFINIPERDIEIHLVENDLSKKYFDAEVWRREGQKLISPDGIVYKLKK